MVNAKTESIKVQIVFQSKKNAEKIFRCFLLAEMKTERIKTTKSFSEARYEWRREVN